ncbi:Pre-mRNA-splicing factor CWC22 [Glycine soja]
MARRRSSESSEDDVRKRSGSEYEDEERDRYRCGGGSSKKNSGHCGDSDLGEERNGAMKGGGMLSDRKSKSRERTEEFESSEEEGQIVNKERWRGGTEDEGDGRGGRECRRGNAPGERRGEKENHRELAKKSERDRDRDRDRDRRHKFERGGHNERDGRARHDSEEEDDRELVRKSERDRDRNRRQGEGCEQAARRNCLHSPFKLAMMMKEVQDKSSVEYQRLTWDALRKSINGLVNKSQMASPGFMDVFAALVAVPQLLAAVKFAAHLVNQQVAHELIALELLTKPTDDSVEVAVGFVTECGSILQDLSPKGLHGGYSFELYGNNVSFECFRRILHEGEIDKAKNSLKLKCVTIVVLHLRGYPAVHPELDLVKQEDQITHEVSLDEEIDPEISLDIFKPDPNFLENEKCYEELKKSMLGEEFEDDEEGLDAESDDDDEDEESDEEEEEQMQIKDETETNLVNLRRTIYLTIMFSVDFEEAGHKLLKIKLEPAKERTYLRYYGLLGQRFCMINKVHQENFKMCFVQQYSMIHCLETNKLRNVAKFFSHLLGTDALPWHVLSYIRLTEEDTTSSRIFIKILFQELSEHLGIQLLNERLNDPTILESFESIFPKDNPKNTRFCINFFTSIGLGGLTENLREICHVLTCYNRNKVQNLHQMMSQGVLIHQILDQLVQSQTQQVLMKVMVRVTEDKETRGESEANLCYWRRPLHPQN